MTKPSDVRKISVSLSEENYESIKELEYWLTNNGLVINRSALINKSLLSFFKCSFRYIEKFNDIDGGFNRGEVPLHPSIVTLLKDLEMRYGRQKLAVWLNYAIYSAVIKKGFPVQIGKLQELEEFEESMKKLDEGIKKK